MTLPLIVACWTLILLIVTGLCATARRGDRAQRIEAAAAPAWEPARYAPIAAHAGARAARADQPDPARARARSLAA